MMECKTEDRGKVGKQLIDPFLAMEEREQSATRTLSLSDVRIY